MRFTTKNTPAGTYRTDLDGGSVAIVAKVAEPTKTEVWEATVDGVISATGRTREEAVEQALAALASMRTEADEEVALIDIDFSETDGEAAAEASPLALLKFDKPEYAQPAPKDVEGAPVEGLLDTKHVRAVVEAAEAAGLTVEVLKTVQTMGGSAVRIGTTLVRFDYRGQVQRFVDGDTVYTINHRKGRTPKSALAALVERIENGPAGAGEQAAA